MLGQRGGSDVPVRADDDETDRVSVEPGLEPPGGIADDGDIRGCFPWVAGGCGVPVQLGGRPDADQFHTQPGQDVQGLGVEHVAGVVPPHQHREPRPENVVEGLPAVINRRHDRSDLPPMTSVRFVDA